MKEILLGVFGSSFRQMKEQFDLIDFSFWGINKPYFDDIPNLKLDDNVINDEDGVVGTVIRACFSPEVDKIHFRLDKISLPLSKAGDSHSVTCHELENIYLNWDQLKGKLIFGLMKEELILMKFMKLLESQKKELYNSMTLNSLK